MMRRKLSIVLSALCLVALVGAFAASASSNGVRWAWKIDYMPGYGSAALTSTTYDVKGDYDTYYTATCATYGASRDYVQLICTSNTAGSLAIYGSGSWMRNYVNQPGYNKRVNFRAKYMTTDLSNSRCLASGKVYA